ncbi:YdcF family protein [Brachybacterium halotolerans subsp. kimchii]|uniref:YdcF family protein n=1 Tax=Brachybacterium halotolerans TaxID=2795215 RepID=UPI001E51669A|nr:YdcF family protein [Brachybacterium halotolerans]UEJ81561.1 YdcF family protein [Brachybacterium halotolerans subsp. kimchii]
MSLLLSPVPILLVVLLILSLRRDARWTGNAFLLSLTALTVLFALAAGSDSAAGALVGGVLVLIAVLSPLLTLVLIGFLIANGVFMMRKEGRSLGNLLSLLAGLGLLAVIVGAAISLRFAAEHPWLFVVLTFVALLGTWAGYVLTSYLVYDVVYAWIASRTSARYVMVHGSGLIRGRVPKLLANRVDAGIAHWRRVRETHPDALLVLSGGQGPDEPRSEASAMAEYAREQGVPQEAIVLEDRSRTTEENLRNTRGLVGTVLPAEGPGLTVTSSYHVLRTAALARRVGLDAQVAPARTAGYFWPSAFLREVVALVARHKILHVLVAAIVSVPLPLLIAFAVINA